MSTPAQAPAVIAFPNPTAGQQLQSDLLDRLEFYITFTRHWSARYSKIACIMRYAIPMMSAVVTVFASLNGAQAAGATEVASVTSPQIHLITHQWVGLVVLMSSVAVTILATYNAAARPMQKYRHFVRYHNKFWKFRTDLRVDLESTPSDKIGIRVREWNSQLHNLISEFSDGSLAALEPAAR